MIFKNKHALVCGSTRGIGKAIAIEFGRRGANVTVVARNEKSLISVMEQLPLEEGQQHNFICADFSSPKDLKEKIKKFIMENSPVNILVNNTGGPSAGDITEAETEEFQNAFSQHLICNHILAQAVISGMKESEYGRIINIISTSVKEPIKGLGVSNTIRGAVANWSKTLAGELAQYGITVNNVLPGPTNTKRMEDLLSIRSQKTGSTVAAIRNKMEQDVPFKRFAEPEEIAYAVCFLASPKASFITGINLPVDGGRTLSL